MTDDVQTPARGRPSNPRRRAAVLSAATDHVLEHGLAGSSLRPLAEAVGSSHRMLLYDFGTKEALLSAVLGEARRRLGVELAAYVREHPAAPQEAVRVAWSWVRDPAQRPYLRLFFEVQIDAMRRPEAYPDGGAAMTRDWLALISSLLHPGEPLPEDDGTAPDPLATLIVGAVRGLLLDHLTTGDTARTDEAVELLVGMLANPG